MRIDAITMNHFKAMKLFSLVVAGFIVVTAGHAAETKPKKPPVFPTDVRVERDVTYLSAGREEKADLYFPTNAPTDAKLPAIVWIHGGGWNNGERDGRREIAVCSSLAQNGYVTMSISYKLAYGKYEVWPTNLWDCKTAVRWLRVNADRLGIDPKRIGVAGGSAGGHLAAMVALTTPADGLDPAEPYGNVSCTVSCCVDMYGIADVGTFHEAKMLGKIFEEAPELYRIASPITYVRSNSPPFLILCGTADKVVNPDQSKLLAKTLQDAGASEQLVVIPGAPHSFDFEPKQRDLRPLVLEFLDKNLKNNPLPGL
jgi:acetyl esterase/lipase